MSKVLLPVLAWVFIISSIGIFSSAKNPTKPTITIETPVQRTELQEWELRYHQDSILLDAVSNDPSRLEAQEAMPVLVRAYDFYMFGLTINKTYAKSQILKIKNN